MKKIMIIVGAVIILASFVLALSSFVIIKNANADEDDLMKVVYHVSEPGRVLFALNNMKNHIKGVEDASKLRLALVVHGPALKEFHGDKAKNTVIELLDELKQSNVHLLACANTMNAQDVSTQDLLTGFARVEEGGVVRLAQLQKQGYYYIRP